MKLLNPICDISLFVYFCLLFLSCTIGSRSGITDFPEPEDPDGVPEGAWNGIDPGLHAGIGSIDIRYRRSVPPEYVISREWEGTGWRGERINLQLVLWAAENIPDIKISSSDLTGSKENRIDSSAVRIHLVRYVITDEFLGGYGYRDHDTIPAHLVADPFENTNVYNLPAKTCRPVWITIDIPPDAVPDNYKGAIRIKNRSRQLEEFTLNLKVQDKVLPPPSEWTYHLDLWLNPFAIARYHKLDLWSNEFWEQLKPYARMLANAGQKCITAIIIDDPWKSLPVYDGYKSMVKRMKKSNGDWEFDYSIFDQYVGFMQECGITEQINCYTMATWGDEYRYFDEDSSKYVLIRTSPGSNKYESFWKPFLIDFSSHLREKGWLEKTCIAMDERSPKQVKVILELIEKYASDIKVAMSINRINSEVKSIYDLSSIAYNPLDKELIRHRLENKLPTTFYTCVAPPEDPNNFTFSPPADAAWLGWYAAAYGYSGFLRYAFCSWTKDPLMDSRYVTWPAGDTYQIYPGPRSSIRFERLREGIQDYEKIRILRKEFSGKQRKSVKLTELNNYLQNFTLDTLRTTTSDYWVNNGNKLLERLSEQN